MERVDEGKCSSLPVELLKNTCVKEFGVDDVRTVSKGGGLDDVALPAG